MPKYARHYTSRIEGFIRLLILLPTTSWSGIFAFRHLIFLTNILEFTADLADINYIREDTETELINREPVTNLTHWHFLLLWLYWATVSSGSGITSRNLMIRFEDFVIFQVILNFTQSVCRMNRQTTPRYKIYDIPINNWYAVYYLW